MNYHFQAHRQVRKNLLEILQNNSLQDLMLIPDGFNNNMYWNIAHTVATQQLLCYYLSGNPFRIDKYWIETYKKGTLPNLNVQQSEVDDLAFLLSLIHIQMCIRDRYCPIKVASDFFLVRISICFTFLMISLMSMIAD